MKKSVIMSLCIIVAITLFYWVPEAGAYDNYSSCKICHGSFTDGSHKEHQNMVGGICNACHKDGSKGDVKINQSIGENGLNISCIGCHGRAEDRINEVSTEGFGAGLIKAHSTNNALCLNCHPHEDPIDPINNDKDNPRPAGEQVLPPYYANMGIDPCNLDSSEDYVGTLMGLDNDGDGLYDEQDPDCSTGSVCTDNDNDGFSVEGDTCGQIDCDDTNEFVHPGAADVNCDGVDNNCDGTADDGYQETATACGTGECSSTGMRVCDEGTEKDTCTKGIPAENDSECNGLDDDCDGETDEDYQITGTTCGQDECAATGQTVCNNGVVEDTCIPLPAPEPVEVTCDDGLDNDCDGNVDGEDIDCFVCEPGDTQSCSTGELGVCDLGTRTCAGGSWGDCMSDEQSTVEVCDGLDNDCDGEVDEGVKNVCGTCGEVPVEVCDGEDNDCDGAIDEGFDVDGDGYTTCKADCNDNDATINPGADEICDGKDNNCDGQTDEDVINACGLCGPVPQEVCDGIDNDCDGAIDEGFDVDRDGYTTCEADCNDDDAGINPGAKDICENAVDENCDGEDEVCPVANVMLTVKAPNTVRIGKRTVSKRIVVFGSADTIVPQVDVELFSSQPAGVKVNVVEPISTNQDIPVDGRPAKFLFKANIQCEDNIHSETYNIKWDATIKSSPENGELNINIEPTDTKVICK